MKIYTKTGDTGETGLFSGDRVHKDDPLLHAYGTIDELNASLGLVRCEPLPATLAESLVRLQHELFTVGADLATPWKKRASSGTPVRRIEGSFVQQLEREIDGAESELAVLREFVLPGGSRASAALHLARTVCRRAEREVSRVHRDGKANPEVLAYLNRLSDWLFVMARAVNLQSDVPETRWRKS